MVERLFHWLPGAKFVLGMGTAGVAWMGRAAASFTESSLQPQDGWAGDYSGHGQPLFLWESFGVRPRFLTCFCLFFSCFWLALAWPPLSDTFSHSCFRSTAAFALTTHLRFVPFLPFFLFWLPCFSRFSLLLPNHSPRFPLQIISQGLNHSSSICMAICTVQRFLTEEHYLPWLHLWSLGMDRNLPPEGASASKGVEGTHKVSALLTQTDGNTDELGVCTCRRAADLLSAPCSNFPPPQSLVSVLQIRHLVLWSGPNSDEHFQPCSVFALKIGLM